jgi:hypothetical protein
MSIQVQQVNYIDACDVIPDGFDDFFSKFLTEQQFPLGFNSYSLVDAGSFSYELLEYIGMLQEESGDSDKDRDGRDICLLTEAVKLLSQLPDNVYVNIEG